MLLRLKGIGGCIFGFETVSQPTKISIVTLGVTRRFNRQRLLFATGELCPQRLRDSLGDLTLNGKDISQLPIVGLGPELRIGLRVDQLHGDTHVIGRLLHPTLENVHDSKLLPDLGQIARLALIPRRRSARDHA